VCDVAVTQPILQRSRIVAGIRQGVAASVPEHVAMDRECHTSTCADALDEAVKSAQRIDRGRASEASPQSVASRSPAGIIRKAVIREARA